MNLADQLTTQAQLRPHAPAIVQGKKAVTYGELEQLVWRAATLLRSRGISPGEVVALGVRDDILTAICMMALARIGATVLSLTVHMPPTLRLQRASEARVTTVLSDRGINLLDGIRHLELAMTDLEDESLPIDMGCRVTVPSAPWLLVQGSGTTGQAKVIPLSHLAQLARCQTAGEWLELTPADRVSTLLGFHFSNTKTRFLEGLISGSSFFIADTSSKLNPTQYRNAGVTILHSTVFHLEQILTMVGRAAAGVNLPFDFLRSLTVGSSTVTEDLRQRIVTQLTPNLRIHYGTNETGLLSYVSPAQLFDYPGTVGVPQSQAYIQIVDGQDGLLPQGGTGHLRVRTAGTIQAYLDNPLATQNSFRDGWFYPGDLGRFAADGQLIYCGRSDHMMIMNGINIYPEEIELLMRRHPGVVDVAAVPLPSSLHQDIPICALALDPANPPALRELLAYAQEHLGTAAPKKIIRLSRIPRTEQGKLDRKALYRDIHAQLIPARSLTVALEQPGMIAQGSRLDGLRQSCCHMRLEISCLAPNGFEGIDQWFREALDMEPPTDSDAPGGQTPEYEAMGRLAIRALVLFRELAQAARLPFLETGKVLTIGHHRQKRHHWQINMVVPYLERLHPLCYIRSMEESFRLLLWMLETPCDRNGPGYLHHYLEQQAIPRIAQHHPMGKSTLHVLRQAHAQDIPFMHLGTGIYQLGWGSRAIRLDRSSTAGDGALGVRLVQNKAWTVSLLKAAGLPIPRQILVSSEKAALTAAAQLGWPVVIKPTDRDRGEGVSVNIHSADMAAAAYRKARQLTRDSQVIVESQAPGVCHRLFMAAGRLLYAVKRLPKSIHGDGRQTVAALIDAANLAEAALPPWCRSDPYPLDDAAIAAMGQAGFSPSAIPGAGERVPLREIESTQWGGFDEEVTHIIHPDNLLAAAQATELFGLEIAGIDIISPDISVPWHANGAIINEVNFAPLLGGGEISRSHIPEYLSRLVQEDGRIPVEAFIGAEGALAAARRRQAELQAQGLACALTSHDQTWTAPDQAVILNLQGVAHRCRALLMNRQVDAILLVIQSDEILRAPLPVDRLSALHIVEPELSDQRQEGGQEKLIAHLRRLLPAQ